MNDNKVAALEAGDHGQEIEGITQSKVDTCSWMNLWRWIMRLQALVKLAAALIPFVLVIITIFDTVMTLVTNEELEPSKSKTILFGLGFGGGPVAFCYLIQIIAMLVEIAVMEDVFAEKSLDADSSTRAGAIVLARLVMFFMELNIFSYETVPTATTISDTMNLTKVTGIHRYAEDGIIIAFYYLCALEVLWILHLLIVVPPNEASIGNSSVGSFVLGIAWLLAFIPLVVATVLINVILWLISLAKGALNHSFDKKEELDRIPMTAQERANAECFQLGPSLALSVPGLALLGGIMFPTYFCCAISVPTWVFKSGDVDGWVIPDPYIARISKLKKVGGKIIPIGPEERKLKFVQVSWFRDVLRYLMSVSIALFLLAAVCRGFFISEIAFPLEDFGFESMMRLLGFKQGHDSMFLLQLILMAVRISLVVVIPFIKLMIRRQVRQLLRLFDEIGAVMVCLAVITFLERVIDLWKDKAELDLEEKKKELDEKKKRLEQHLESLRATAKTLLDALL